MDAGVEQALVRHFAASHGLVSRRKAVALGVPSSHVDYLLRSGRWTAVHRGVYRPTGQPLGPEGSLLAAVLSFGPGAVSSHAAAAWLWELVGGDLPRIVVTAPRSAARSRQGVELHRRDDLPSSARTARRGVPVTDPTRTLCDLGETEALDLVQSATDVAIARRLVKPRQLLVAALQASRPGRPGPGALRRSLVERGLVGAPHPSVLESRVLRLLHSWGVVPLGCEVVVSQGAYRVDVMLRPGLVLEADGFTFHSAPAAKAADDLRRNRLQLDGMIVLQTNWLEVETNPERLRATVFAALALVEQRHLRPTPCLP